MPGSTVEAYIERSDYGEVPAEQSEANARLTAAAPRMFEALERLSKLSPQTAGAATAQDLFLTVRAIADSALAEARGEA